MRPTSRALKLWTNAGVLLASVVTTETPGSGGWFQMMLPTPVHVNAGAGITVAYDVQTSDQYPYDGAAQPVSETTALAVGGGSYSGAALSARSRPRPASANHFADLLFRPPGLVWPIALKGAP